MPTDVLMPQMGESIAEGTIERWLKKVGETVDRDEPLFEISTDKVDAEIPSTTGGVLAEIRAQAGVTVPVNSVVAVIVAEGDTVVPAPAEIGTVGRDDGVSVPSLPRPVPATLSGSTTGRKGSPLVRRLAAEHKVDLAEIVGTGGGGRVTKADVLAHLAGRGGSGADPLARRPDAYSTVGPAERLSVDDLDAAITDLATRAKSKQLSPADVGGGTFTITNPGSFGSVFGLPIINQPQSAILCVGAIEKRPVVVDDAVVARPRAFLTLGFDQRLIDGAVADQFLARVKDSLERVPEVAVGKRQESRGA